MMANNMIAISDINVSTKILMCSKCHQAIYHSGRLSYDIN